VCGLIDGFYLEKTRMKTKAKMYLCFVVSFCVHCVTFPMFLTYYPLELGFFLKLHTESVDSAIHKIIKLKSVKTIIQSSSNFFICLFKVSLQI
jgi:hypothetical protein